MRLSLVACLVACLVYEGDVSASRQATVIAPHEAEILARLLPQAIETAEAGFRVGLTGDVIGNSEDVYLFALFNASRTGSVSRTLGACAINKRTATVVDLLTMEPVETPLIVEMQGVLRRHHQIEASTISRYDSLPPLRSPPAN